MNKKNFYLFGQKFAEQIIANKLDLSKEGLSEEDLRGFSLLGFAANVFGGYGYSQISDGYSQISALSSYVGNAVFGASEPLEAAPTVEMGDIENLDKLKSFLSGYKATPEEPLVVAIGDIDGVLLYAKEHMPIEYEALITALKDQGKRYTRLQESAEIKDAYQNKNMNILRRLNVIQDEKRRDNLFGMVEGFVEHYAEAIKVGPIDLSDFKNKCIKNELTVDDCFILLGKLQMDCKSIANLWVMLAQNAEYVERFSKMLGYEDIHTLITILTVFKDMATEDAIYFAMTVVDALHLNDRSIDELTSGRARIELSYVQVLEIISEMPKSINSYSIIELLESDFIKRTLTSHTQKVGYEVFLAFLENIGDGDIYKGLDCVRQLEQGEIEAIVEIHSILKSGDKNIDALPLVYQASKKLKTTTNVISKVMHSLSNTLGFAEEYKQKIDYMQAIHAEGVDEKTIDDLVLIVKSYRDYPSAVERDSNYGSASEAGSDSEAEDIGVLRKSSIDKHFEALKHISHLTERQIEVIGQLGFIDPRILQLLTSISDELCDEMKGIVEDALKISDAEDQKKAVLLVLTKISRLDREERVVLLETINRVLGSSLPMAWANSEMLLSIGRISPDFYDEIEEIRKDIAKISEENDPKKATLLVIARISRLEENDRKIFIQAINATFGSSLPEALANSEMLLSIGRISPEFYDEIEEIRKDIAKISEEDDTKKATLLVITRISRLEENDKRIFIQAINATFGSSLPEALANSEKLLRLGAISPELYDKIEVIRKDISNIPGAENPRKAIFLILKKMAALNTEERRICIEAMDAVFGSTLLETFEIDLEPGVTPTTKVFRMLDRIDQVSDNLYDRFAKIRKDLMKLPHADNRLTALLMVTRQIASLDVAERILFIEIINATFDSEVPIRFANAAIFQAMDAMPRDVFDKIIGIEEIAAEMSESNNKIMVALDFIARINALEEGDKSILAQVYELLMGDDDAPRPVIVDEGLYGTLKDIFADISNLSQAVNKFTAVINVAKKIDDLTPEDKETLLVLVRFVGNDACVEKVEQLFEIVSLCDERNIGVDVLHRLVADREPAVEDLSQRVMAGTSDTFKIIKNVFKGSTSVRVAKDVFILVAIIALTVSVLVAGAMPFAMVAIAAALVNIVVRLSYDLYRLHCSNQELTNVRAIIHENCEDVSDVVDFLSVLLNENAVIDEDDRNDEMVRAAQIMRDNVEMQDFGGIAQGVADDVGPEVNRIVKGR